MNVKTLSIGACALFLFSTLLSGCSNDNKATVKPTVYETAKYAITLPIGFKAKISKGETMVISKSNETVGLIEIIGFDSTRKMPPGTFQREVYPNHAELVSEKDIRIGELYVHNAVLKLSQPAASNDQSVLTQIHYYFPAASEKYVYDLWFNLDKVGENAAFKIAKTFKEKAITDRDIQTEIKHMKRLVKIGESKTAVLKKLSKYYKSKELIDYGSGDGFASAYLFAYSNDSNPFEVREGQSFDNGQIHGVITKIKGDSFWIVDDSSEFNVKSSIYGDLIASRNHFFSDRKIGVTIKVFFDSKDTVNRFWIEYVQGKDNKVRSIEYYSDGTIKKE